MIELKVSGMSLDPASKSLILVLRTTSGLHILPLWIGPSEAVSISLALQDIDVPRPLTHDLFLSTIESLGYLLKSIKIINIEDGIFYAQLELTKGSKTNLIDCRPSDAVALAIRAQAPILATQDVMDKAGLEYPKDQKQVVPVSAGDGAIAMISPEHDFSILAGKRYSPQTVASEALNNEVAEALANMDPESKYKM